MRKKELSCEIENEFLHFEIHYVEDVRYLYDSLFSFHNLKMLDIKVQSSYLNLFIPFMYHQSFIRKIFRRDGFLFQQLKLLE